MKFSPDSKGDLDFCKTTDSVGLCCCAFQILGLSMSGRAGPKGRPGRTHAPVMLVRATNEPDSLFQTRGSSPSYSRSRRRPPDVWWHRTCVAWRSFRTRGRFACRRRTLALLRRHPPTLRRPAPSSQATPKNFCCRDERARRRVGPIFTAPAMASSSSPSQIICVSFNQDNRCAR